MNNISLIGRAASDPEIKVTTSGTTITKSSFAFDSGFGDNKKSNFLTITLFGKQAEIFAQNVSKGQQIGLVGELSVDKVGDKTYANIAVSRFFFLSKKESKPQEDEVDF